MCLLCSTLAWQGANGRVPPKLINSLTQLQYSQGPSTNNALVSHRQGAGIIIYSSRTHSQLAQVIKELKSTSYRPRMSVLGSREQLCVHDKISKLKSSALNHACNCITAQRSCMYKNNLENFGSQQDGVFDRAEPVDIGAVFQK